MWTGNGPSWRPCSQSRKLSWTGSSGVCSSSTCRCSADYPWTDPSWASQHLFSCLQMPGWHMMSLPLLP